MNRRRLLVGCGAVISGALAGCSGGGSDTPTPTDTETATPEEVSLGGGGDTGGDEPDPTTPAPETPTATESSGTETPGQTATATQTGRTHGLNERFTVGEGETAVGYQVRDLSRTDRIGNAASNKTAEGTYLVVVVELTNPSGPAISFPVDDFRAKADTAWHKIDEEASEKIGSDDRVEADPLVNKRIRSGDSITGAVAFDVRPADSYRLWITPRGRVDTPEHFVPVGEISSVQQL